jgi:RHS repeat-associated protein
LNSPITNATLGGQTLLFQQYDEYGRLTNSVDRNEVTTSTGYDFLDRLVTRQNFGTDGKFTGQEKFAYSALGLTNYTDPLTHHTTFGRDASGRVLYETNANTEVLQYTYNPSDELLTLTDGKNQTTTWDYDEFGRVIDKVDAAANTDFTYGYDANDRLTSRLTPEKGTTVYRYDPIGNLTNVDYSGGTVSTPSVYFAYDGLNRLVNMADGIGTTAFGWTDGDQLASETGPWPNDSANYAYNSARQRGSLSLLQPSASPWTQGYAYDSVMRLSTVTSPAGGSVTSPSGTFAYTYSGGGDRVLGLQLPGSSSLYITNRYDSLARLTNTWVHSPLSGVIDLHEYSYDPGSEVTQQVFTAGNFMNYSNDAIGQLKSAKGYESGGSTARLQEQFGYGYDAAWNLNYRTNNALIQSFSVNNLNELSSASHSGTLTVAGTTTEPGADVTSVAVSGTGLSSGAASVYADGTWARAGATPANGANSYSATANDTYGRSSSGSVTVNLPASPTYNYDSNGNLTNHGTRNFAYDVENQLVGVWVASAWSNSFAYDGLLRKRIERDFSWNGSSWLQTNEVQYVYDVNLVVQERDGNNLPVTTYTRGNDLSGDLQDAGGIGGLLARSDRMSVIPYILSPGNPNLQNVSSSFYHADGNGNVTALMQPNGLSVASYKYDPYGNMISMSGLLASANKYRFSSKEWNDNAGLYSYGYRFYDPNLQRWLNRDPLGEESCLNLYNFVDNDPLNSLDPYGLALFGLYDTWGDYFNDVGNTFAGEAKGAGSQLSFGLYSPCYRNSLQRQGGYVGQGLAMAGETLAGGAAGWNAAGDAAKGLEYSHWVPARALPGGRGGLLDDLTKAAKLNGNYVSKAEHALSDPSRYRFMPKTWKAANPLPDPLTQQLNRVPLFPTGLAAGAGAAAAGAAASSGSGGGCH